MRRISRRDLLRASAAVVAARTMAATGLAQVQQAAQGSSKPPVIWLSGQACSGCSVSLLNSIHYQTIDDLLINTIDLKYHPTIMAGAGDRAVSAADTALGAGGYVLVVEGAIPLAAQGDYCHIWPGMTMHQALLDFSQNAQFILAVGTCASFGGMSAGSPNPTQAKGVRDILGADPRLINVSGCPAHPDWVVGTVAYLLTYGQAPALDSDRRPLQYFRRRIHSNCPNHRVQGAMASKLSDPGCLMRLGCKGQWTYSDCFERKWNSDQEGAFGVNWCIGARSPCQGCVQPTFPDGMSPFFA